MAYILAIDQGTTSTRAIIFDRQMRVVATAQRELTQSFPKEGWVEHDAEQIWSDVLLTCQHALSLASLQGKDINAIGITNQRETSVIWHKKTGKVLAPAIVWQDRRTTAYCETLKADETMITAKTGLLLDPYFCATKIRWFLDNVPEALTLAKENALLFGTIDSFLLWRLTGGQVHATDATNAARTLLFNIHENKWDLELLNRFDIPATILPAVKDNVCEFGKTDTSHFGSAIPILAMAGDQQAAMVGQACFSPGMIKSTYGTGCFMVMNLGAKPLVSNNRLLTTIAYRLQDQCTYALEGSIFIAGAAVQWLRDAMHLIAHANETESIAKAVEDMQDVYLVPAFTGLGAPYWDPLARGAILGLTRYTGVGHIVRAALESVCYQTRDLLSAMRQDTDLSLSVLRVDGGMVHNDWLMQFLADILQTTVERPHMQETTALGTALLAGLGAGWFKDLHDIAAHWQQERLFTPLIESAKADQLYQGWQAAVARVRTGA